MRLPHSVLPAALAFSLLAVPALAQDPSFRLNNRTNSVIMEVYVSSARNDSWGADRLGANILSSGQVLNLRLPQGQCVNDIKVVYEGGRPQEWRRVNTCDITDFDIN